MNEVTVLAKVGEGTGRAVGTGMLAARRSSMWITRSSATAGLGAARMTANAARARAAKRGAAQLEAARAASKNHTVPKVAVPTVTEVRQELAKRIEPKRRRRWPYVVGILVVGAGAAAVAVSRRPVAPPPAPAPPTVDGIEVTPPDRA